MQSKLKIEMSQNIKCKYKSVDTVNRILYDIYIKMFIYRVK
jgi:hypothetical protein